MADVVGEGLVTIIPDSSAFVTALSAEVTAAAQKAGTAISTQVTSELNRAAASAAMVSTQLGNAAKAAAKVNSSGLAKMAASAQAGAVALVDAAAGAELLDDALEKAARAALTVNSALDAIDSQDLDLAATAAQYLGLALGDIVPSATALNSALDAIDPGDINSITAAANAAASALLDMATAAELVDIAITAINPGDLAIVFAAANSAAGQLAAMAAAALAVDAALNSIDTTDLLAVIAAASGASGALAAMAAASQAAGRGLGDGSIGLTGLNAGLSRTQLLALAAGVALLALGGYGVYVAGQFEQTQVAFEGILGSAEQATEMVDNLKSFAAQTPFEFAGLNDAARRLLGVGFAAEEIIPTLTTLGDTAAVLGAGEAQINGVVRALGQIQGKGRVMAQELNQISEQLPGFSAIKAVAEGLGVTTAEAFKMVEAGAVSADEGIQLILDGMKEFPGAAEAMEKQSQTLLGRLSTFKDTLILTLDEAFRPLADTVSNLLVPLSEALAGPLEALGPILGSTFSAIADALFAILPPIETFLNEAGPGLIAFNDAIGEILVALSPALGNLASTFGKLLTALTPLIVALTKLLVPLADGLVIVTEFSDGLGAIILVSVGLAYAFSGLLTPIITVGVAAVTAGSAVGGLGAAVSGAATAISLALGPIGLAIIALSAVSIVLAKLVSDQNEVTITSEQLATETDALADAFYGSAKSLGDLSAGYDDLTTSVGKYAMEQGILSDSRFADDLDRIGITASQLGDNLQSGEAGLKAFVATSAEADEIVLKQYKTIDGYRRQVTLTAAEIKNYEGSLVDAINSGQVVVDKNPGLVSAYIAQENAIRAANQATFESLVEEGKLTQAQADRILGLEAVTASTDTYGAALADLPTYLDDINSSLSSTQVPLGQQAATWVALADAIGNQRIAADEYARIAEEMGVDLDDVEDFASGVTDALNEIVDAAVSQLPTAETALGVFTDKFIEANQKIVDDMNAKKRELLPEGQEFNVDMEVKLEDLGSFQRLTATDIANFAKEIDNTAGSIDQFDANLAAIRAVSEPVADFLAEQGPEAAGKMAEALASMPATIQPVADSLANLETQTAEFATSIRNAAIDSPKEAAALASRMTTEFDVNLDFTGIVQREIDEVNRMLAGMNGVGSENAGIFRAPGLKVFAAGGIVDRATAAIVGEAGREYILPESDPARSAQLLSQAPAPFLAALLGMLAPMGAGAVSGPAPGTPGASPVGSSSQTIMVAPVVNVNVTAGPGADAERIAAETAAKVEPAVSAAARAAAVQLRTT